MESKGQVSIVETWVHFLFLRKGGNLTLGIKNLTHSSSRLQTSYRLELCLIRECFGGRAVAPRRDGIDFHVGTPDVPQRKGGHVTIASNAS